MKKLLLLLTAVGVLAVSAGCMYTAMTSDTNGKVYLTRTNLGGLWNNSWICEPNGGKLNCVEAAFEGTGGAPAPSGGGGAAPPPAEGGGAAPPPAEGGGGGGGEEGGGGE